MKKNKFIFPIVLSTATALSVVASSCVCLLPKSSTNKNNQINCSNYSLTKSNNESNSKGERLHSNFNPKNTLAILNSNGKFHKSTSSEDYVASVDLGINMDYINACLMYTAVNIGQTPKSLNLNKTTQYPIASDAFFDSSEFNNHFFQVTELIKQIPEFKKFFIEQIKAGKLFIYPTQTRDAEDIKTNWTDPHITTQAGQDLFPVFNYKIYYKTGGNKNQYLLTNLWSSGSDNEYFDQYHNIIWLLSYGQQSGLIKDIYNINDWKKLVNVLPTLNWYTTAQKYKLQNIAGKTIHAVDLNYTEQERINPNGSIACQINELLFQNVPEESIKLNIDYTDYSNVESGVPHANINPHPEVSIRNLLELPNHRQSILDVKFQNLDSCEKYCSQQNFTTKRIKITSQNAFNYYSPFYKDLFLASDIDDEDGMDDYSKKNGITAHQCYQTTDQWTTPDDRNPESQQQKSTTLKTRIDSVSSVEYNLPEDEKIIRRTEITDDSGKTIASFKEEEGSGESVSYKSISKSDVSSLSEEYKTFNAVNFNLFLYAQTPATVANFITTGKIDTRIYNSDGSVKHNHWGTVVATFEQDTNKTVACETAIPFTIEKQKTTSSSKFTDLTILTDLITNKSQSLIVTKNSSTIDFKYYLPTASPSGTVSGHKTVSFAISGFAEELIMKTTSAYCPEEPNQLYQEYSEKQEEQKTDKRNLFLDNKINYSDESQRRDHLLITSYTKSQLAPEKDPSGKEKPYDPKAYDQTNFAAAQKSGAISSSESNPSVFPTIKNAGEIVAGPYSAGVEKPTSTETLTIHYNNLNRVCQTLEFTKNIGETGKSGRSPYYYSKLYDEGQKAITYTRVDFRFIPLASEKNKVKLIGDEGEFEYELGKSMKSIIDSDFKSDYQVPRVQLLILFNNPAMKTNKDILDYSQLVDSFEIYSGSVSWINNETKTLKDFSLKELKDNGMIEKKTDPETNDEKWFLKLRWKLKAEHLNPENVNFLIFSTIERDKGSEGKEITHEYSSEAILSVEPIEATCSMPYNEWKDSSGTAKSEQCFKNKGDNVTTKFEITSSFSKKYIDPASVEFTLYLTGGTQQKLFPKLIEGTQNQYHLHEGDEEGPVHFDFEFNVQENSNNEKSVTKYELKVVQTTDETLYGHITMLWKMEGVQSEIPSTLLPEWYSGEPKPDTPVPPPPPEPTPTPTSWWTVAHILGVVNIPICVAGICCCIYSISQHNKHKNDKDYDN